MKKVIHRAETRGRSQYDWLDSKHNFSFAGYSDRDRVNFGALRVLNDDIVQPGTGFGKHPHDNMEIISIPLKGGLQHKDSTGRSQVIKENEVQVMSAGTGIFHAEYNPSDMEIVNFLQIWIYPDTRNVKPVYSQKYFDPGEAQNQWQKLVTGVKNADDETLIIHQEAKLSRIFLSKNNEINYKLNRTNYGSFLFVIEGEIEVGNETISARDAIGISGVEEFKLKAKKNAYVLNIEVPELKR